MAKVIRSSGGPAGLVLQPGHSRPHLTQSIPPVEVQRRLKAVGTNIKTEHRVTSRTCSSRLALAPNAGSARVAFVLDLHHAAYRTACYAAFFVKAIHAGRQCPAESLGPDIVFRIVGEGSRPGSGASKRR